jgi:hypothetical protein
MPRKAQNFKIQPAETNENLHLIHVAQRQHGFTDAKVGETGKFYDGRHGLEQRPVEFHRKCRLRRVVRGVHVLRQRWIKFKHYDKILLTNVQLTAIMTV